MAVSSAPAKVYLFGEHAVVYGEPAVPCAIDRRARVRVRTRSDGVTRVEAVDLRLDGLTVEYDERGMAAATIESPGAPLRAALGYIDTALTKASDAIPEPSAGFDVRVESDIPLGAGLGSSAAVTVATLDAATRAMGSELDQSTIADLAYRTEHSVQDGHASRADTFCSTMGGAVRVEGGECVTLDAPDLAFAIGFDGSAGETGALVAAVKELTDTYPFAADAIGAIGDLVRAGETALAAGDLAEIGRLMDINHGLLGALGVSSPSLDDMVWAARGTDVLGAKLTGAGGGGCIVALGAGDAAVTALHATPACESAFLANLDPEGVRVEASL